jgi:hypothetical protein
VVSRGQPAIARIVSGRVTPTVATLDRLLAGTGQTGDLAPRVSRRSGIP